MEALIIVDVQNDFCPGGALPVKNGDEIIPLINELQKHYDLVVVSQDWHPKDHGSFASTHHKKLYSTIMLDGLSQVLWPDHCVQHTPGAELRADLDKTRIQHIVQKGTEPNIDSYSAFFDNGWKKATGLHYYLKEKHVTDVHIVGLATDYCVKYTALDSTRLGYNTSVILEACRGIGLHEDDIDKAVEEMMNSGVNIISEPSTIGIS